MADIFVDKILHNTEIEKKWFEMGKDLTKVNGITWILNQTSKIIEEVSEEYWNKKTYPKSLFKGDLKITEIADQFKLKPLKTKLRICPFHEDHNKSLSLSNEKGIFHCFGCGKKGNIITFYAELKKVKQDDNK